MFAFGAVLVGSLPIILVLLFGIGFAFIGFGPLSRKRHPEAGDIVAVAGFWCGLPHC